RSALAAPVALRPAGRHALAVRVQLARPRGTYGAASGRVRGTVTADARTTTVVRAAGAAAAAAAARRHVHEHLAPAAERHRARAHAHQHHPPDRDSSKHGA